MSQITKFWMKGAYEKPSTTDEAGPIGTYTMVKIQSSEDKQRILRTSREEEAKGKRGPSRDPEP